MFNMVDSYLSDGYVCLTPYNQAVVKSRRSVTTFYKLKSLIKNAHTFRGHTGCRSPIPHLPFSLSAFDKTPSPRYGCIFSSSEDRAFDFTHGGDMIKRRDVVIKNVHAGKWPPKNASLDLTTADDVFSSLIKRYHSRISFDLIRPFVRPVVFHYFLL